MLALIRDGWPNPAVQPSNPCSHWNAVFDGECGNFDIVLDHISRIYQPHTT